MDAIRELLLLQAGSARGRDRVAAIEPRVDLLSVRTALAATEEAVRLLRSLGRMPYHDLPDLAAILPAARVRGNHLETLALSDVASFLEGAREIAWRVARAEGAPHLAHRASTVWDGGELATAIRRAILPSGEVADDASPALAELRRSLLRLRAQLTQVMEGFLHSRDTERILQDRIVTTRNDRYVLLVKAEHRGQLPGVIHGSSGSGASLFVEPLPAVELNNDIVSLQEDERAEVVRILKDLTARVGARGGEIAAAVEILGELDAFQAMALLAGEMGASLPEVTDELRVDLVDARHPLLIPSLAERLGRTRQTRREPVPVSIRVEPERRVLIISGPNTGGKTVALKTVGLLALMAQCGLHIPAAAGSVLPVFRRIFADIGDDQSIAENLSTFSAHLATIVDMTRDLVHPALVLLDEVGGGTDPTEGGALGVAVVEHFRRRGAVVVATTHHGLMKAYAQSTEGVECASFGYIPDTWEPTYRLAIGVPGRSLALEMAERLGMPAEVVSDARSRRDEKEAQAEALLERLERERYELERDTERVAAAKAEAEGLRDRLAEDVRDLASRKRSEVEAFAKRLRARREEAEAEAQAAIRAAADRVVKEKATATALSRIRAEAQSAILAAERRALADPEVVVPEEPETRSGPIETGSRVRARSLGVVGEVVALLEHDLAELAVGGKRLRVPRGDLVAIGGSEPAASRGGVAFHSHPAGGGAPGTAPQHSQATDGERSSSEINLIGLTVDEALPRVDKLLDQAALAERSEVRVIHGFGQGRLREAVAGLLRGHPHVAAWRPGGAREGGGGVTVVELRD